MSKTLFKSVSLISLTTFISRILGFIRDLIAAHLFGVGPNVDAFYIAFKIPNFMRNIFAEGAFSQAFIPVLLDYRQICTKDEVHLFIRHISAALLFILVLVTISGMLGSTYLIRLFAPGLDADRFQLASAMLRITFPYLILISFSALIGSILNSYNDYIVPAFTPALLNIWRKFSLQLCFANSMLALFLWRNCNNLSNWLNLHAFQRVTHLLWLGCGAILIYVFCLWLSDMKLVSLKVSVCRT